MRGLRKILIIITFLLTTFAFTKKSQAQVFYIGVNGSMVYSWFDSPKFDNIIYSEGLGWDLGFFLRYGKKPYFQAGFDWVRSQNEFSVILTEDVVLSEVVRFHDFEFSFKVGYNIIDLPMFKYKIHAGPFIGKALMFSSEDIRFENSDFRNPQMGIIAGTGIQFTNFIVDFEYSYHFTQLFKPVDIDGQEIELGSKLQLITLKVGFMF